MKNLLLFPLLLLCSLWTFSSFAQGDFAPIGATWHYDYYNDNSATKGYILQESVKDTILLDQSCRKLNRTIIRRNISQQSAPVDTIILSSIYVYSNTDTVFYYNSIYERFLPLYIFNVEKGDTMTFHVPYLLDYMNDIDTLFQLIVKDITYSTIDNQQLKTIHTETLVFGEGWGFGGSDSESYTEKIGTFGLDLLSHSYGYVTGNTFFPSVRCYEEEGFFYKKDVNKECTEIPSGSNTVPTHLDTDNVTVYPNPCSGYLNIELRNSPFNEGWIKLWDARGRLINSYPLQNKSTRLDLSGYQKGLYFITMYTNTNSRSLPIILN